MRFRIIEEKEPKHLRDIIQHIDTVVVVDDVFNYHFSTDEVIDESLYEDEEDIEIYTEENLLNLTDEQLLQIPKDQIHGFTNTELIERIYNLDKSLLSAKQIEILKEYCKKYRVRIDSKDVDYFLSKLKKCTRVNIAPRPKNDDFMNEYDLSENDILNILKQLTIFDYIENRKSINLGHLTNNLMVFQPSSVVVDGKVFKGLYLYIKVDMVSSTDKVWVVISFHETKKKTTLKGSLII